MKKKPMRRITLDLTPAVSDEVDRIKRETGMSIADIFRHSFTLLRIYVDETAEGNELALLDGDGDVKCKLIFPTIQSS